MECVAFINRLLEHTKEFCYIMIYEKKSCAAYFNKVKLFQTSWNWCTVLRGDATFLVSNMKCMTFIIQWQEHTKNYVKLWPIGKNIFFLYILHFFKNDEIDVHLWSATHDNSIEYRVHKYLFVHLQGYNKEFSYWYWYCQTSIGS